MGTDIDLDGLVPNQQRQLTFSQPAQRRHTEKIDFPEFVGRGSWVVDLLGGGQRSRALIHKGAFDRGWNGWAMPVKSLKSSTKQGASSQPRIWSSKVGNSCPTIKVGSLCHTPSRPYRAKCCWSSVTSHRRLLITHHSEAYELQAGFLVDRQSLVAGAQASLAIRPD
ncbi:MAG: hypothetical protein R3C56_39430 [Pirellulaceae bacterium]